MLSPTAASKACTVSVNTTEMSYRKLLFCCSSARNAQSLTLSHTRAQMLSVSAAHDFCGKTAGEMSGVSSLSLRSSFA